MESLGERKAMEKATNRYNVKAEICKNLDKVDLQELCDATEEAVSYTHLTLPTNREV